MPSFRTGPVRVRVPATSANLGPGFDCAGLALTLYDDVEVRVTGGGLTVEISGEGSDDLPRSPRHLVVTSLRAAFDRLGGQPPGLAVQCTNAIPQSRGLGSSSAAICAAVLAARALVDRGDDVLDDVAVLQLATALEGHPDNVAACLRGGATFAWDDPVQVLRVETHPELSPIAFVPATRSSTRSARRLLPPTVPFSDAVANAGRSALLATALSTEPTLLLAATQDRLHQQYRSSAMPRSTELVTSLRSEGVAAVLSGAGPCVLALVLIDDAARIADLSPPGWQALSLSVDAVGARLLPP